MSKRTMGSRHVALIVGGMTSSLLVTACFCPATALPHIRPGAPDVVALLEFGRTQSATFRTLVARIERGPVVVYVRFARCRGGVAACLHFLGARDGERTARITLDRFAGSRTALCVLLAHELQHAVELMEARDVLSREQFQRFMSQLGRRSGDGFETSEAVRTARAVERELTTAPGENGRTDS